MKVLTTILSAFFCVFVCAQSNSSLQKCSYNSLYPFKEIEIKVMLEPETALKGNQCGFKPYLKIINHDKE